MPNKERSLLVCRSNKNTRRAVKRYREALELLPPGQDERFADCSGTDPAISAEIGRLHVADVIRARRVVDKWGNEYEK
jgi:hypothetical protein